MAEQPVLQLVHISDLHIKSQDFYADGELARLRKLFRHLDRQVSVLRKMMPAAIADKTIGRARDWCESFEHGFYGHTESAIAKFQTFLQAITVEDDEWQSGETWIVDTGDLTTYGDEPSLREGLEALQSFSDAAGNAGVYGIYGNHDAWPGTQPILANKERIEEHRERLRREFFKYRAPEDPLALPLPGGRSNVLVYRLNTVLHDRLPNFLALGEVQHDRYWEHDPAPTPGEQLRTMLDDACDRESQDGLAFRIVLSHHPVREPEGLNYKLTMRLINDEETARILSQELVGEPGTPLAHLVLSGHTHETHPRPGRLAAGVTSDEQADRPAQLVVGSLSKIFWLPQQVFETNDVVPPEIENSHDSQWPHQCQILRLYFDPSKPRQLRTERLIAAREYGRGEFKFVPHSGGISDCEVFSF